jgi:hypothetical protein
MPQAKEVSAEALRREMMLADALCAQEEADISDAETLNSDSITESEDDSYESDFIDDSNVAPDEIPQVPFKFVRFSAETIG